MNPLEHKEAKPAVQFRVGGGIRGRIQVSFHLVALQVDDNHVLRLQLLIGHAAGLDDKESLLPVDSADISPGKGNQSVFRKLHICLIDDFLQFFKHVIAPFS